MISKITFEDFEAIKTDDPFYKKMKRGLVDDNCKDLIKAVRIDGVPVSFIATKRVRNYHNLKWVMTLPEARGKGAFREMCEDAVADAFNSGSQYFRVSINENALKAYFKVGFRVLGEQRGNCYLSMGKLTSPLISKIDWSVDDTIWRAANQRPRGGCTVLYIDPPEDKQIKLEL